MTRAWCGTMRTRPCLGLFGRSSFGVSKGKPVVEWECFNGGWEWGGAAEQALGSGGASQRLQFQLELLHFLASGLGRRVLQETQRGRRGTLRTIRLLRTTFSDTCSLVMTGKIFYATKVQSKYHMWQLKYLPVNV